MKLKKILIGTLLLVIGVPVAAIAMLIATLKVWDETNGSIVSSGFKREYLLHVPPNYDRAKPVPLVISLHGAAGWPKHQRNTSRWDRFADSLGFIVVYPSGIHEGPRIWHVERGRGLAIDVRFIADLIDTLAAHYNIDRDRIYANGLSNGGGMSFVLSCTMSDRIAAVGLVSSAQTLPWDWCTDHRPVPMIMFHSTADPIVPYNGGFGTSRFAPTRFDPNAKPFPNIPQWAANWARRNGCAEPPLDSTLAPNVVLREWTHCTLDAPVVFYTIQGAGHQWPGGNPIPEWMVGPPTNAVDATSLMWAFFQAHPLIKR
jgi:polyhydroxybutyrate depolymerase